MKKLYDEFLCVPENGTGKIREKVFVTRMAISVILILACMVSMSLTAYAYFSHSIVASSNIVKAADLKVDVSVKASDGTMLDVPESNDKTLYAALGADEYEVRLSLGAENSAGTGFCMLSFDGGVTKYHTQQFIAIGDNAVTQVAFKIKTDAATQLSITLCWGTSSYYSDYVTNNIKSDLYILDGETVLIATANPINPITDEQEGEQTPEQPEADNEEASSSEISEGDEEIEETPNETSSAVESSSQTVNSSSIAVETSSEIVSEDEKEETKQPTEQTSEVESSSETTETTKEQ